MMLFVQPIENLADRHLLAVSKIKIGRGLEQCFKLHAAGSGGDRDGGCRCRRRERRFLRPLCRLNGSRGTNQNDTQAQSAQSAFHYQSLLESGSSNGMSGKLLLAVRKMSRGMIRRSSPESGLPGDSRSLVKVRVYGENARTRFYVTFSDHEFLTMPVPLEQFVKQLEDSGIFRSTSSDVYTEFERISFPSASGESDPATKIWNPRYNGITRELVFQMYFNDDGNITMVRNYDPPRGGKFGQ
jgi:hypothetical protein